MFVLSPIKINRSQVFRNKDSTNQLVSMNLFLFHFASKQQNRNNTNNNRKKTHTHKIGNNKTDFHFSFLIFFYLLDLLLLMVDLYFLKCGKSPCLSKESLRFIGVYVSVHRRNSNDLSLLINAKRKSLNLQAALLGFDQSHSRLLFLNV